MTAVEKGLSTWDVFICHASEDKDEIARPLANELRRKGIEVWYDEFSIQPGDSFIESVEKGLRGSLYGILIISKNFFKKN